MVEILNPDFPYSQLILEYDNFCDSYLDLHSGGYLEKSIKVLIRSYI